MRRGAYRMRDALRRPHIRLAARVPYFPGQERPNWIRSLLAHFRRHMLKTPLLSGICLAVAALSVTAAAHAQAWPTKPIRLIVPYAAGGPADVIARVVAKKVGGDVGQTIIVDNKGGAGGTIGVDAALKSAAGRLHLRARRPGPAGRHAEPDEGAVCVGRRAVPDPGGTRAGGHRGRQGRRGQQPAGAGKAAPRHHRASSTTVQPARARRRTSAPSSSSRKRASR